MADAPVETEEQAKNQGVDAQEQSSAAEQPEEKVLPPLWRSRDFMLLWGGQVVSALGGGIY